MDVDGVRRRLRDVGKTVSGVLGAVMGEVAPPPDPEPAQAALPQTGSVARPPGTQDPVEQEQPVIDTAPVEPAVIEAPVPEAPVIEPAAPEPAAPDRVLAAAVEQARAAAEEAGGSAVGEHLGVSVETPAEDGPVLTHAFATTDRAYVGWRWSVTLARAEGGDVVTVDEVVLLPGPGALVAPSWVPWSERLKPGDLTPGDLLPPPPDDGRLVPAYAGGDDTATGLAAEAFWELGLGRPRVLSLDGRVEAAQRWWDGEPGPAGAAVKQAPGRCVDCGFLVPLAGGLRQAFGVCANALAPDDGRVVALAHGCGAHSETVVELQHVATAGMAVEDDEFELVAQAPAAPTEDGPSTPSPQDEPA